MSVSYVLVIPVTRNLSDGVTPYDLPLIVDVLGVLITAVTSRP